MSAPENAAPAGSPGASATRRRRLGAFYTPEHAVTYMVSLLRGLSAGSRVLEPSGGDGAFVSALLHDTPLRADQVHAWDLDPAVEPRMRHLGVRFTQCDALLETPTDHERFTHAIGNPPYLNKQSAYLKTHRDQLRRRYADIGAHDTYAMFIAMALGQLAPGGQLVFLVSDTFLTLGIHRKLRELLVRTATLDSLTLLPAGTFPDAAVRTVVLAVTASPASPAHEVVFHDLRSAAPGVYDAGTTRRVRQAELAANPGTLFAFTGADRDALATIAGCPTTLLSLLDGGLGLHTGDNARYLRVVDRPGVGVLAPIPAGQQPLPAAALAAGADAAWRPYHKRGGAVRWWRPAEHAIAWDEPSRATYGIPATALAGAADGDRPRDGFVVSGIAAQLSARLMTPGALWESNKAFGFFPKDPGTHPVEMFVAVLNSAWYSRTARTLNHTVSLQIRDLAALPWLPFTPAELDQLAELGSAAIGHVRRGGVGEPPQQERIDALVQGAAARVLASRRTN